MMANQNRGNRLIFVGGSPRSGTTLVQNMLDCHPDICGAPEFFCIPNIVDLRKNLHELIAIEWIDAICSYEDVDSRIASLIETLLLPLADRQGCTFLSEKTPRNVLVFPELIKLFPEAHFIHVIRDPRAVVASLVEVGRKARERGKKPNKHATTVTAAIHHVKDHLRAGLSASASAPDKVLTLLYEDVVTRSEIETKKICQFLKIDWSEEMMHPGRKKHLGEKAQTAGIAEGIWYNANTYNRDPDRSEIDKWKTQLTALQKVLVTKAFADIKPLRQLGYDLSLEGFPQTTRGLSSVLSGLRKGLVKTAGVKRRLDGLFSPLRGLLTRTGL